jgi:hypothetical protein
VSFFNSNSRGWSPTGSIHLAGRPPIGLLYLPRVIMRIWLNDDWKGKLKYSEKTWPSATLSNTNPTYVCFILSELHIHNLKFWSTSYICERFHLFIVCLLSLWMAIHQCCILMLGQFSASLRGRCCSKIFEAHRKKRDYLTNFSVTELKDLTLPTWKPLRYTPYLNRLNAAADSHETHFPNKYFIIILPFQHLYSKWTILCFAISNQMISPHQITAQHNLKKNPRREFKISGFHGSEFLECCLLDYDTV